MADPLEKTITVYYKPGKKPNYSLSSDLPPIPGIPNGFIFRNDGHPGFKLNYTLDPESFGELVFPNDPQEALCVTVGDQETCPQSGTWGVFKPLQVKAVNGENRILVVRNYNGKLPGGKTEERFAYTLYVTQNPNGDPGDFIALDPIGSNQNGHSGFNLKSLAVPALIVAAVGAIAYLALA